MELKFTGKIIVIGETQKFESGFQKLEIVIEETEGKYPQPIKFELLKDKVDSFLSSGARVGNTITVDYNLRGNEYKGKYYNALQAWKFEIDSGSIEEDVPGDVDNTEESPF